MGVILNASGEYLKRTTDLPSTTNFTLCGWAKVTSAGNEYQYWGLESEGENPGDWLQIGINNANTLQISRTGGGADLGQWGSGILPGDGDWFFYFIMNSGTGSLDFIGGVMKLGETFTTTASIGQSFTPGQLTLGNDGWDEYFPSWEGAYTKVWDAVLSQAELGQEIFSAKPVRTANLHIWSPHFPGSGERNLDYSGNGRDWTEAGTPTDGDGPPISWGSVSPLTLFEISGVPISDDTPAFLQGSVDISDDNPAFTAGSLDISDDTIAYAKGAVNTFDDTPAYTKGSDNAIDFSPAYLKGSSNIADNQSAYLKGSDDITDTQSAYLKGSSDITDVQSAFLDGSIYLWPFSDDFTGSNDDPWDSTKWTPSTS